MKITVNEKRYGPAGPPVIRDLEFQVTPGEILLLFGPSGCGKSTLLHLISGLDTDFSGDIHGQEALNPMGYVFQEPRLLPWYDVAENIRLVLNATQANDERIDRLLSEVDLAEAKHRYAAKLSLGMARRVSIARALAIDPALLLMDEPFVSLDAPTAARLRALLLSICKSRGLTVIFVTHDIREAVYLADRILFLSSGPAKLLTELKIPLSRDARDPAAVDRFITENISADRRLAPLLHMDEGSGLKGA